MGEAGTPSCTTRNIWPCHQIQFCYYLVHAHAHAHNIQLMAMWAHSARPKCCKPCRLTYGHVCVYIHYLCLGASSSNIPHSSTYTSAAALSRGHARATPYLHILYLYFAHSLCLHHCSARHPNKRKFNYFTIMSTKTNTSNAFTLTRALPFLSLCTCTLVVSVEFFSYNTLAVLINRYVNAFLYMLGKLSLEK